MTATSDAGLSMRDRGGRSGLHRDVDGQGADGAVRRAPRGSGAAASTDRLTPFSATVVTDGAADVGGGGGLDRGGLEAAAAGAGAAARTALGGGRRRTARARAGPRPRAGAASAGTRTASAERPATVGLRACDGFRACGASHPGSPPRVVALRVGQPQSGPVRRRIRPFRRDFALSNREFTHAYLASHVPLLRVGSLEIRTPPRPARHRRRGLGRCPGADGGRRVGDGRGRAGSRTTSRRSTSATRWASDRSTTATCPRGLSPSCSWAPTSAPARATRATATSRAPGPTPPCCCTCTPTGSRPWS